MDNKEVINVDLSFGPAWARESSEKRVVYESPSAGRSRPGRRRDDVRGRGNRDAGFARGRAPESRDARTNRRRPSGSPPPAPPQPAGALNLKVSFIPEGRGLKPLVKQFAGTRRAYALFDVASTFLSRPEFYAASIETAAHPSAAMGRTADAPSTAAAPPLYQCVQCRAVFTSKQAAFAHGISRHLDLFYEKEEKECEAPQGNFSCVARCTLSGELLGPPNHHGFSEKLQELHRTRFANLPLDAYRKKIVNESDAALIEQWKKAASRKTIFRTKRLEEPLVFEHEAQLEQHFAEHYAATLIKEGSRFVIPATASQDLDDPKIKQLIQEAWQKEINFPINMAFAIQNRFRRLGLHVFKTSKITFVSSVKPHPINPGQTTETIRQILEWVDNNRGKTRQDLATALAPGLAPDSENVAKIINALVWLIDRGHVIEFMNGTLAAPNNISRK